MKKEILKFNIVLNGIYYCPHHPDDGCTCRKPKHGLFLQAAGELGIDLGRSFMIGDSPKDIEAGKNAGCRAVLISPAPLQNTGIIPDHTASNILNAVDWIVSHSNAVYLRGEH